MSTPPRFSVFNIRLGACLILGPVVLPHGTPSAHRSVSVRSVLPLSQTISAPRNPEITVTFDGAVDAATVSDETVSVFGRWSGVATGTIVVEAGDTRIRFLSDKPFFAGEWVTVSISRGVRSATGEPLATGYAWNFWVRAGRGSLDLEATGQRTTRRAGEGRIQTYGAYAGDIDHDGYSDLVVPNELSNDVRVFLNDKSGRYPEFTILPIPDGSVPSPNEGADFNRDGHIDFAVGNAGNAFVSVYTGHGDGTFRHTGNYRADRGVRGVCLLDLNGDGATDIATANMRGSGRGNSSVLLNDGTGDFRRGEDVQPRGRAEKTCATADANGDGILDMFVGAYSSREVVLLLGDGEGGLEFSQKFAAGGRPWMIGAGDVNGDGNVDVVTANREENSVSVLLGDGRGNLAEPATYRAGRQPLAIDVGDIDGDGDLDVLSSNVASGDFTLFENAGDGTLINPRTLDAGSAGSCAIIHDRDNDGDLDVTGIDEIDDLIFYFDNTG